MGNYDIAAYIWPAYTGTEARSRIFWPEGRGEWQSVASAKPKFDGHKWPKKPLWGYVDEADPKVMEMEINEALSHGVNIFIYDWYWFDNRPFLEQCLNNGFLKAGNNADMKFYIMWANHNANYTWDKRLAGDIEVGNTTIWSGAVSRSELETIEDRVIEQYFKKANYYKINGCPVFMLYDVSNLMKGLGGVEETASAIKAFRCKVKAAGFPDLHFQLALWGEELLNLSGVDGNSATPADVIKKIGVDSLTHYQFCHFADVSKDYLSALEDVKNEWKRIEGTYSIPFFSHVSIGWDNNPRFNMEVGPILKDCTPENFKKGLLMAKDYVDTHPGQPPLITINSWNEWTENSYLEPDDMFEYGFLNAIKEIFGE